MVENEDGMVDGIAYTVAPTIPAPRPIAKAWPKVTFGLRGYVDLLSMLVE